MNDYANQLLPALLLATLGLTVAAVVTWCLLRYSRAVSPRAHRLAWCAVLLVGWSFARLPIEVPWYDPVLPAELAANFDEPPPMLLLAPTADPFEAPAETGIIELSGTYEELSPEPSASAAGAEPPNEPVVTPELSAPILAEMPLVPPAAVTKLPEQVVRSFWTDIDPWLTLTAFWAAGIGAIVLAWLAGYLWFILRLPVGRAADPRWLDEWQTLRDSRGVRRSIPLRVTLNFGPMLCRMPGGYTLVVPEPLWRELDESGRRAILRHELAHYERGDVWWSLLARVLALPNWFNPASWYCVRKFDEAAEWACDRAATADQPVTDYARALLRLGTDAHGYASYRPAAAGKPLAGRIRRLLRLRNERDSKFKAALLIAAALVMATAALVQVELVAREAPEAKIADAEPQARPVDTPERIGPLDDEGAIPGPVEGELQPVAELEIRPDPPADQTKLLTAAQAAADGAKKAYEGTIKAYEYGRGNPDSVYTWSLRWMDAAGRVPPEIKEGQSTIRVDKTRLDAAKAHLERMKELQTRVKAQYDTGTVTYEVIAAADYYAAEAERVFADLEAKLPKLSGALEIIVVPQQRRTAKLTPTPATPDAQPAPAQLPTLVPSTSATTDLTPPPAESAAKARRLTELGVQGEVASNARKAARQASEQAVEVATRGFEATKKAYESGSITLDVFLAWSQRWMNAAQRIAQNDAERLQAANDHLERMRDVQKHIKRLHDSGTHGGDETQWQEINFYVTEAERNLAELEAAPRDLSGSLSIWPQPGVPAATLTPTPAAPTAKPTLAPTVIGGVSRILPKNETPTAAGPAIVPVPGTTAKSPAASPIIPAPENIGREAFVRVRVPRMVSEPLAVQITPPTSVLNVDQTGRFTIAVANFGKTPLRRLKIVAECDPSLDPASLTEGYGLVDDDIVWGIDELPSTAMQRLELQFRTVAAAPAAHIRVTVTTNDGTNSVAEAVVEIRPAGDDPPPTSMRGARPMGVRAMGGVRPLGTPTARVTPLTEEKLNLRYDGKSFVEWSQILETELSQEGQFKAIEALGAFAARGYGEDVAALLFNVHPEADSLLETRIRTALSKVPKATAVVVFSAAGKSDDAETRRLALIALANAAPESPETKAALKAALHDSNHTVVNAAVNVMGTVDGAGSLLVSSQIPPMPELAPDLVPLLAKFSKPNGSKNRGISWRYSVNALAQCGPAAKVALPTVIPWLTGEDSQQRRSALTIVRAVGAEAGEAVPALIELLKQCPRIDAEQQTGGLGGMPQTTTSGTLAALGAIGPAAKEAVPTIVETAESAPNAVDVIAAIEALGSIGPDAAEAEGFLQELLNSKGLTIGKADAAREALKRIRPEQK